MDKNKIKSHLESLVAEANKSLANKKAPGLVATEKTQRKEASVNKDYYKEVSKKMGEYDKIAKGDKNSVKKKDLEKVDSEEMDVNPNGMDQIQYDNDPAKKFKDRAIEALEGSAKMGNETHEGKWDPATGKGNGNTEEVWGASGNHKDHLGKRIVKGAKTIAKKDAEPQEDAVGYVPKGKVKTKLAVENTKINKKTIKENNTKPKMKRLNFKKPFNGVGKALTLIPETYKVDDKVFEMTDGNESYKIRWEGSLTEGSAVILMASDKNIMNEDIQHMKHLMGFKAENTLGTPSSKDRINEDSSFRDMMNLTNSLLNEDVKSDKKGINEVAGAAGAGFGFTSESNLEENEEVTESEEEVTESKGETPQGGGESTKIGDSADGVVRGAGHDTHIMEEDGTEVTEGEEITENEVCDSCGKATCECVTESETMDESFESPTVYTLSEGESTQSMASGDDLGTDIGKSAKGDPRGEGHDTHIMEEDGAEVTEGIESLDEVSPDEAIHADAINFLSTNKNAEAVKKLYAAHKGGDKNAGKKLIPFLLKYAQTQLGKDKDGASDFIKDLSRVLDGEMSRRVKSSGGVSGGLGI